MIGFDEEQINFCFNSEGLVHLLSVVWKTP